MPLIKATLAMDLESALNKNPAASALAAQDWAKTYVSYAGNAMSSAGSLPVNAQGNMSILVGAFSAGLNAMSVAGAAAAMAQGVMAFWQAIAWAGPAASGATAGPGNSALASALQAIFSDLSEKSVSEKANALADAFDAGARMVIASEVQTVSSAPLVGPIN